MNRPTPKRSSLSGASPVQPAAAAPEVAPQPTKVAAAKPKQGSEADGKPMKVGFYQPKDENERTRAASMATMVHEGHTSLSDFISKAVMREVQRLEKKYNGGEEFGRVPTRANR